MSARELYENTLIREDGAETVLNTVAAVCFALHAYDGMHAVTLRHVVAHFHGVLRDMAESGGDFTAAGTRHWFAELVDRIDLTQKGGGDNGEG